MFHPCFSHFPGTFHLGICSHYDDLLFITMNINGFEWKKNKRKRKREQILCRFLLHCCLWSATHKNKSHITNIQAWKTVSQTTFIYKPTIAAGHMRSANFGSGKLFFFIYFFRSNNFITKIIDFFPITKKQQKKQQQDNGFVMKKKKQSWYWNNNLTWAMIRVNHFHLNDISCNCSKKFNPIQFHIELDNRYAENWFFPYISRFKLIQLRNMYTMCQIKNRILYWIFIASFITWTKVFKWKIKTLVFRVHTRPHSFCISVLVFI